MANNLVRAAESSGAMVKPTDALVFEGTGILGRGQLVWPPDVLRRVAIGSDGLTVFRARMFVIPEELHIPWASVQRIELERSRGWKYRQRVAVRTCVIHTKDRMLRIDVSRDFPDVRRPHKLLNALEQYFPLTRTKAVR